MLVPFLVAPEKLLLPLLNFPANGVFPEEDPFPANGDFPEEDPFPVLLIEITPYFRL